MATFHKRGKRWQAKIRRTGYQPQSATFATKGEAEQWAREIESQMDRGRFVALTRDDRRLTLREALDRYLLEVTARKRGRVQERVRIAAWMRHPLADRPLAAIRTHDLAQHRNARLRAGLSPNTVRLELAVLSHVYTIARSEWRMEALSNPVAALVKPGTASRARDRRLRDGEEDALLAKAVEIAPWLAPTIKLAIATAMRRGELATLEWSEVDCQHGIARLDRTKNGDRRDVPLSDAAIDALRALAWPAGTPAGGNVALMTEWPKRGKVIPASADLISHRFIALTAALGIEDLTFHDLRHEATSRLFERGDLDIVEIAAITGHKTLAMLKRYTHPRAHALAKKMRGGTGAPRDQTKDTPPSGASAAGL